jgi:hypothetical protein
MSQVSTVQEVLSKEHHNQGAGAWMSGLADVVVLLRGCLLGSSGCMSETELDNGIVITACCFASVHQARLRLCALSWMHPAWPACKGMCAHTWQAVSSAWSAPATRYALSSHTSRKCNASLLLLQCVLHVCCMLPVCMLDLLCSIMHVECCILRINTY